MVSMEELAKTVKTTPEERKLHRKIIKDKNKSKKAK